MILRRLAPCGRMGLSGGRQTDSMEARSVASLTAGRPPPWSDGDTLKKSNDSEEVAGKQPGFYLYPADLERELRPLPVTAQALWVRMLLQMHWAARRGYLEHPTGEPFSSSDIARMVGMPLVSVGKMLDAMENRYGTFSRDEHGVIFNRRMVRDTDISNKRKAAGRLGGNPNLVGNEVNQHPKQNENLVKQIPNQIPTPSSSSSSSVSAKAKTNTQPRAKTARSVGGYDPAFESWFEDAFWPEYWRSTNKAAGKKALAKHATTDESRARILASMLAQKPGYERRDTEKRPYLSTWANQERFNDAPELFENGHGSDTRTDREMQAFDERMKPYAEQRLSEDYDRRLETGNRKP